jgi:hypothetical protein
MMTTNAPTSGVNGARTVEVIPQIGNLRADTVGARKAVSALYANTRFIRGITTDAKPARMQTFITVAVAYTYPGIIVVTDPPPNAGLSMSTSRMMAAKIADNNVPSVRVDTTTAQIPMVCLFVFTFVPVSSSH